MPHWPRHGRIAGPIVMIGFGSIGKGTLPLIERHFEFDPERFVVIDPNDADRKLLDERGVRFVHLGLTRENYRDALKKYLTAGEGQGFCVNLSVDTSSLDIMRYCRELGALYIDTVVEPWPGFYFDKSLGNEARTNYALRETVLEERRKIRAGRPPSHAAAPIPAWSPGSSSRRWSISPTTSATRRPSRRHRTTGAASPSASASKACTSPSATPSARSSRSRATYSSTPGRSRASCRRACSRPNSAGARTRNGRPPTPASTRAARRGDLPQSARRQHPRALMDPDRAGAVRLPRHPQRVDLDRRLLHRAQRQGRGASTGRPATTPITPATTPCCSLHELFGRAGEVQSAHHILGEAEILDGVDELGVLLYGHARNAYWYGSQLSVEETRALAPYQNATGMQVTSAVLAGMVWALENPKRRHRRGRRTGFPPLPRDSDRPISARSSAPIPTGRRSWAAPASSPRTSTRAIPGSSGTCW